MWKVNILHQVGNHDGSKKKLCQIIINMMAGIRQAGVDGHYANENSYIVLGGVKNNHRDIGVMIKNITTRLSYTKMPLRPKAFR